jgi:hypothetical protein
MKHRSLVEIASSFLRGHEKKKKRKKKEKKKKKQKEGSHDTPPCRADYKTLSKCAEKVKKKLSFSLTHSLSHPHSHNGLSLSFPLLLLFLRACSLAFSSAPSSLSVQETSGYLQLRRLQLRHGRTRCRARFPCQFAQWPYLLPQINRQALRWTPPDRLPV